MAGKKNKKTKQAVAATKAPVVDKARPQGFRWQRGAEGELVEAEPGSATMVWRSNSGVIQLHRSGRIGDAEFAAAHRFRADHDRALREGAPPDMALRGLGGGGSTPDGWLVARCNALASFREASKAVGARGTQLLLAFVVEGLSLTRVAELAKLSDLSRQNLAGAAIVTLERLSEHYRERDSMPRSARRAAGVTAGA